MKDQTTLSSLERREAAFVGEGMLFVGDLTRFAFRTSL